MTAMDTEFIPRPGALRYREPSGIWHYANPHDPTFSTVTMLATEHWDGSKWVPIFDDDFDDA